VLCFFENIWFSADSLSWQLAKNLSKIFVVGGKAIFLPNTFS